MCQGSWQPTRHTKFSGFENSSNLEFYSNFFLYYKNIIFFFYFIFLFFFISKMFLFRAQDYCAYIFGELQSRSSILHQHHPYSTEAAQPDWIILYMIYFMHIAVVSTENYNHKLLGSSVCFK